MEFSSYVKLSLWSVSHCSPPPALRSGNFMVGSQYHTHCCRGSLTCVWLPFIISHVNIRTSFRAKQKQTLEFSTYSVYLTAQTLSLYSRFKLSHFHTRVMCVFCLFLESYSMYLLLSPKRMCKMDGVSAGIIQQWNHVITRKQTWHHTLQNLGTREDCITSSLEGLM